MENTQKTQKTQPQQPIKPPEPSQDEEYEADRDEIPCSHEIILQDHTKVSFYSHLQQSYKYKLQAATALDLDPSGSRLVTGSHDYDIKLWDFAAMNSTLRPFKSFEGCETNHVSCLFNHPRHSNMTSRYMTSSIV